MGAFPVSEGKTLTNAHGLDQMGSVQCPRLVNGATTNRFRAKDQMNPTGYWSLGMVRLAQPMVTVCLLLSVGCSAASGPAARQDQRSDQDRLAEAINLRLLRLIHERDLPYEVHQAEFQAGDAGETWWIVQLNDPIEALGDRVLEPGVPSSLELVYFQPLRLYRDSVEPFVDRLEDVSVFILSFRDPAETVFEMEPSELFDYVKGELTDEEMVSELNVTVTDATGEGFGS